MVGRRPKLLRRVILLRLARCFDALFNKLLAESSAVHKTVDWLPKKICDKLSRSSLPVRVTEYRDVESVATGTEKQTVPELAQFANLARFTAGLQALRLGPAMHPLYAFPGVLAGRKAQPFRLCQPSNWLGLLWEESSNAL